MTDSNELPILGWVAGVKSNEEKQHLTSPEDIEVDSDYNPDNEHRAPVPSYNDFATGNTPADGNWGLAKKEQRDATDAHKREQKLIKKREQRRRRKMRQRASTQNNGAFTSVLPLPATATLPNTAIPSFITISREFELKPLEFNSTTPSTSTGPADGNMTGRVPKRKRHHYAYNTYPSAIKPPVPGKSYVNAATQTEPEHTCIGNCQCSIRTTPKPTAATAIATAITTATATAEPLARRISAHVPHTQPMLALRRKADARSDAFRREAGIEPLKFDRNDPEEEVVYEKQVLEGGGLGAPEADMEEWKEY